MSGKTDKESESKKLRRAPHGSHGPQAWTGGDGSTERIRITELDDDDSDFSIPLPIVGGIDLRPDDYSDDTGTAPDARPRVAFGVTMPAPLQESSDEDIPELLKGLRKKRGALPQGGELIADRYRVIRVLGEGGMGQVFEVAHIRLGKSFALKLLRRELSEDKKMRSAFFREAKYASSLDHQNLISVLDYGEDSKHGAYIVMELASGRLLSQYLVDRGQLSVKRSCDIILQVAEALAHIHERDLIHCDLKPQNIMLIPITGNNRRRYSVRVLDFGLAQSRINGKRDHIYGTPAYISPEVAQRQPASAASDIYSLGILFFQLITGQVPFRGDTQDVLSAHIVNKTPTLSQARGKEVDIALEKLVEKSLQKAPEDRHSSMSALIYELRNFMQMTGSRQSRRAATGTGTQQLDQRGLFAVAAFEAVRLPLAMISKDGTVLSANPAFSKFVLGIRSGIEGSKLQDTPLAPAWSSLEEDLESVCGGSTLGRRVEIDTGSEKSLSLQMWLEPTSKAGVVVLSLHSESQK